MKTKQNFFKRALSGVLSAACVLSGTAFAGMTALNADETVEVSAATAKDASSFSWDNATVYFLLTDRFKNGDTSNDNAYGRVKSVAGDSRATFHGGDFAGITQKINEGYFDDLGVNAIWMTAPYEQLHGYILGDNFAHYSYHGYYVTDYTEPDAAYGTKQEFQTLVDTAHEHGIRIIMDIVMNHAGYNNMIDMNEYNYGTLLDGWKSTYDSGDLSNYHKKIDYTSSASDWGRWWGTDWVRSGLPGYNESGNGPYEQVQCLTGLPDFRTESTNQVSIPQFLQTKWQKEGTLSTKMAKYGSSNTVTGYISTWLAEWVETYGIDGFRCDTAKHVEFASWNKLKQAGVAALKKWRQNNPGKAGADWTDEFWMTGECWDHGCYKDGYYTDGGFDSMINFETQGGGLIASGSVANTYASYASKINNDDSFNVLSYVSSHDSTLARPSDMYYLGSALLMLPGCVQIYYGDETNRPYVSGVPNDGNGGAGHSLRSDMNWDSYDKNLVAHWGKVGNFRKNHVAVGGGQNVQLTASAGIAFGRTYDKNGVSDKIIGVINAGSNVSVSIDVGDIFANGTQLHNYYDDTYATVSGGKVTFNSGAHGTILIEVPSGPRGVVKVTHINKTTNETIKEETLSGGIGEAYQTSALSLDGYTVASTSGKTSGTFTESDISVTYYYTFDTTNYAYVVTKHVDSATGAEIAESTTETKKIGTSYTTSAASIKNYEVDTVPANASGTVTSGTTTVTYKYTYVEPTNLIVHYYNSGSWSDVYLYAYDESSGTAKQFTGAWPGTKMTSDGDGWFSYSVDSAEAGQVIFNSGSDANKDPSGNLAPGYKASGEVWIKNKTVYPTGKVNVKYVTTDGKTLATDVIKGIADGTTKYTTSAKSFDGYELSSTPSNASGTFTESAVTVVYTYKSTASVVEPTKVTLSKTSLSVTVDSTASLTATVTPSNATDKTVTWTSSNTAVATVSNGTVKGIKAGTATITAKTSNGKTATCSVTVTAKPTTLKNNSTVSADLVNLNSTVTITGKASGGTSPYKYAFYYKKSSASSWTTIGTAFGSATTATFKPTTEDIYEIKVVVKDNNSTTAAMTTSIEVMNLGDTELKNNSTINSTTVSVNSPFKLTASASGGTAPYKYAYYYKRTTNTTWKVIGTEFGTATTASFTPTSEGTFDIKVVVKDSDNKTAIKSFTGTAGTVSTELTNTSKISSTSVAAGDKVTITGGATGGTAPYKYAFYYMKSTDADYTLIGEQYGSATSASFYPPVAGTYKVMVRVKDAKAKVSKTSFTVKAGAFGSTLKNTTTINNQTIKLGSAFKFTGSATGGTAPYKYAFYFKRTKNQIWKTLGTEFSTTSTARVTPTADGYYEFKVLIMDSTGKVATKTFSGTVKK